MADEQRIIKNRVDCAGVMGPVWIMGWLFTIGFLHLQVVKALFALVLWPYYLGGFLGK